MAAALEALLPSLPAPRCQPEPVDEDDWRLGGLGTHGSPLIMRVGVGTLVELANDIICFS
jgi:hypothetical protein